MLVAPHKKKEVMLRVFLNPLSGISSFFLFREVSEGERERNINYRMCWVSCLCHDKQQQSQSTAKSQKRARKMGKADRTMFVVEPFLFSFFSFCFFLLPQLHSVAAAAVAYLRPLSHSLTMPYAFYDKDH